MKKEILAITGANLEKVKELLDSRCILYGTVEVDTSLLTERYEFTDEEITYEGHTLHRIKALVDIPQYNVKKGDLGGFIEKETNLERYCFSPEGNDYVLSCWVGENALVMGDSVITECCLVTGNAVVINSRGEGISCISGNTKVENSHIWYGVRIDGYSTVSSCKIGGDAVITGEAKVENSEIFGGVISDKADVYCSELSNCVVRGNATLGWHKGTRYLLYVDNEAGVPLSTF